MRTFAATTSGISTQDQVAYMSNQRQLQNKLANSGGGVTVPQFSSSGLSAGTSSNDLIAGMAQQQLQSDAQSKFNSCVGQSAASCPGTGGRRRKTKRSRKHKLKTQKKKYKV